MDKTTPGMSEDNGGWANMTEAKAREIVNQWPYASHPQRYEALAFIAGIEQEREKSKEKDRRIEFLKDELFRYRGLPIPPKEKSELESSRQEIERLKEIIAEHGYAFQNAQNKTLLELEAERQSTRELVEFLEQAVDDECQWCIGTDNNIGEYKHESDCPAIKALARHKAGGKAT